MARECSRNSLPSTLIAVTEHRGRFFLPVITSPPMDRRKFTIQVPLENPNDAQPGVLYLTPEEEEIASALADHPEEFWKFIEQVRRKVDP